MHFFLHRFLTPLSCRCHLFPYARKSISSFVAVFPKLLDAMTMASFVSHLSCDDGFFAMRCIVHGWCMHHLFIYVKDNHQTKDGCIT